MARRPSIWKNRYDVIIDGRQVATWHGSSWMNGGTIELGGRRFQVKSNVWGSTYGMVDEQGSRIAVADRVGRKDWTITVNGVSHQFHRASPWRQEEELHVAGRRVGTVRRTRIWRGDVEADLPGMPLEAAVFVLSVVLNHWDTDAVTGSAG